MADEHASEFTDVTVLANARQRLREAFDPIDRTDRVPLSAADGRVLAETVTAGRNVPHYDRAAMDGYAVRATDTFGASDRSPATLSIRDGGEVGPGDATWVHTGSALPPGADAVIMVEHTEAYGEDLEVLDGVADGENVAPVGEDVAADQPLFEPGHRLRPSDLGLLKAVGIDEVTVVDRPSVAVVPTGDELVQADPDSGEVVETNGFTVSRYVRQWGGEPTYRDVVPDDRAALRSAIQRDLTRDVIVTSGGSSVGRRDLLPDVLDSLGEMLFHGVAIEPGHPIGVGVVEERPVVMLPGYPVSTIVGSVQLLRPLLKHLQHCSTRELPTTEARLERKIASEPGERTFARVRLDERDGERVAEPTRTSGAGVLSSVALADGWVVVPEEREGIPEGERVAVEDWEYRP
jgi:molybdopterin molybdotransferase